MQSRTALTLALLAGAYAAPQSLDSADLTTFETTIQNAQNSILEVIADVAQLREASCDYEVAGAQLNNLLKNYFPATGCAQPTDVPVQATTSDTAIQYLEDVQLELSIVEQDAINSDYDAALSDLCGAILLFNGVADFVAPAAAPTTSSATFATTAAPSSSNGTVYVTVTSSSGFDVSSTSASPITTSAAKRALTYVLPLPTLTTVTWTRF